MKIIYIPFYSLFQLLKFECQKLEQGQAQLPKNGEKRLSVSQNRKMKSKEKNEAKSEKMTKRQKIFKQTMRGEEKCILSSDF